MWRNFLRPIQNKRLILEGLQNAGREKFKTYRHFWRKTFHSFVPNFCFFLFYFWLLLFFFISIELFSVTGDVLFEFRIFIMLIFFFYISFSFYSVSIHASSFSNTAIQKELMNIRQYLILWIKLQWSSFHLFYYYYFSLILFPPIRLLCTPALLHRDN